MRIQVKYQGELVGALDDSSRDGQIFFQYDREFIASGIQLSPLQLPLNALLQSHNNAAFERLHGLFYDSLPDKWGRGVLRARLAKLGIEAENLGPLGKLSWVGSRGMGGLTYEPERDGQEEETLANLDLLRIAVDAKGILSGRYQDILPALLESGTSAGGARPKMLIGINRQNPELIIARSHELPDEYDAWLLKIETDAERAYCKVEYAYFLMARAAGIEIPEVRLVSQPGGDAHFASKRFDRQGNRRIHVHSMAGLLHHDFNVFGTDYRDLFLLGSALTADKRTDLELFRRVAFNYYAAVRDDHAKNHSFLLDGEGWKLTPAFDLTYAKGRGTGGQLVHEISLNGKSSLVKRSDLLSFAKDIGIPKKKAIDILDQVSAACRQWEKFAEKATLSYARTREIQLGFEPFDDI